MREMIHLRPMDVEPLHKCDHEGYESFRRPLVAKGTAEGCLVTHYEIPPGKAAYPYHYHAKNEECFYIISGKGRLKTPKGEREVLAGEFLYFPANEAGAHKLTNASETEMLVYIDFDTFHDLEASFYPDSGKIGVWGKGIDQLYETKDQVEYYRGE